ncbi:MAG: DsbA family protein [Pseudomonadota bacterium]
MSLKTMLMPMVTAHLLGEARQQRQRARAERARNAGAMRHRVHYFHQVDDPYSALACASLAKLLAHYDIELQAHVVGPPATGAAPQREMLSAYSRKDAQLLAERHALPFRDAGTQPAWPELQRATGLLVAACADGSFAEVAADVAQALWQEPGRLAGFALRSASETEVDHHISMADALRLRLGHYLGATFYYAGEWYWGIDRLHHLERRLQQLGARRDGASNLLYPPPSDSSGTRSQAQSIDFYFSLRSPYSAIAAPRVFALADATGATVNLRFVLPMVMRGLPVPRAKRMYIVQDAAREARRHGIAFGRLNDPLGRPTERGLALVPAAERAGLGRAYLLSFMHGVWAEGIDAGSTRGLRKIVERCGMDWRGACTALQDESWRETAEQNRRAMFALGLWGVPSFQANGSAFWGQDRLWALAQALEHTD